MNHDHVLLGVTAVVRGVVVAFFASLRLWFGILVLFSADFFGFVFLAQ
jgi:hypothetical protein